MLQQHQNTLSVLQIAEHSYLLMWALLFMDAAPLTSILGKNASIKNASIK